VESLEDLEQIPIPAPNAWLDCLRRETERIAAYREGLQLLPLPT